MQARHQNTNLATEFATPENLRINIEIKILKQKIFGKF